MSTLAAPPSTLRATRPFTRFAWGVLGWNILVVLWGAYVRASASGDGCGNHWPLCNGQVVPTAARIATLIEFTHRAMTTVAFLATLGLLFWSLYLFPRAHRVRKAAMGAFAFLLAEAALGAGLVLFNYVAANASAGRVVYLSLHLVNTQFLLALLALTAWFSRDSAAPPHPWSPPVVAALPFALLVGVSGAVAALGDTLFHPATLAEGVRQDLSSTGPVLLRLRVFHPLLAVLIAAYLIWIATRTMRSRTGTSAGRLALWLLIVTLAQLCAGVVNLALLAPIPLQILHLLLADLVWLSLVLLAVEA